MIRENYLFAIFSYPNYIFTLPLLIAIILLVFTDIRGHFKEIKSQYKIAWSPPHDEDVPSMRKDLAKPIDDYKYIHKGFKFGKWLKGSETKRDVPGYKDDESDDGH